MPQSFNDLRCDVVDVMVDDNGTEFISRCYLTKGHEGSIHPPQILMEWRREDYTNV